MSRSINRVYNGVSAPLMLSSSGSTSTDHPRLVAGYIFARRAAIPRSSASVARVVTPGRSRPTTI